MADSSYMVGMMNRPRSASYLEVHSAMNRPLVAFGLLPSAGEIVLLILGLVLKQPWFFVLMGPPFVLVMISVGLLYRNWSTGIRIDEAGIGIGAVTSARAWRRRPTVNHQGRGLFTCPWSGVQGVRVVTDPADLRELRTSPHYYTLTSHWGGKLGMEHCNIGVLTSPFMRAALVVEVDPFAVTASRIRPARYYSNFKDGRFSHLVRPRPSPTWIVPTRHPEALRAALQNLPGGQRNLVGWQ